MKTLVISSGGNLQDQLELLTHEDEDICGAGCGSQRIKLRRSSISLIAEQPLSHHCRGKPHLPALDGCPHLLQSISV